MSSSARNSARSTASTSSALSDWESTGVPPAIARARKEAEQSKLRVLRRNNGELRKDGIMRRSGKSTKPLELEYGHRDNRAGGTWSVAGKKATESDGERKDTSGLPELYKEEPLRIPKSERELLEALVALRSTPPRIAAEQLFEIHSHPNLRHLVSKRTYTYLLTHSYKDSNLRLAREVLQEMKERRIPRDETIMRILLKSNLIRGDKAGVESVLDSIRDSKVVALPLLNWRRDLGEAGRGQGDAFNVWHVDRGERRPEVIESDATTPTKSGWKGKRRVSHSIPLQPRSPKPTVSSIPDSFETLSTYDIKALVESLVQTRQAPEAFLIAQSWLDVNRPSLEDIAPPPSAFSLRASHPPLARDAPPHRQPRIRRRPAPIFVRPRLRPIPTPQEIRYKAAQVQHVETCVVLLNILVKALLSTGTLLGSCKSFVVAFTSRNSFKDLTVLPNQITLIELIAGLKGDEHSWVKSVRLVNWFGTGFGFEFRLASGKLGRRTFPSRTSSLSTFCSAEVGTAMLRLALEDRLSNAGAIPVRMVRKWWMAIDKREAGWRVAEVRRVVNKAVERSLLLEERPKRRIKKVVVEKVEIDLEK